MIAQADSVDKPQQPVQLKSCRLWSLWDMLELNAVAFYTATTALRARSTFIHEQEKGSE
jgi:hypothetical protein